MRFSHAGCVHFIWEVLAWNPRKGIHERPFVRCMAHACWASSFCAARRRSFFFTVWRIGLWQRKRRGSIQSKIYSMCLTAGIGFLQFVQTFYQPDLSNVIAAIEDDGVDEDDRGDPDSPHKHLHRQLRRIRRGERVDHLEVRL